MANGLAYGMKNTLTIDSAGRFVLPQPVRKRFHLDPGAVVELDVMPDAIILRPRAHDAFLVEEQGLLVHEGERIAAP